MKIIYITAQHAEDEDSYMCVFCKYYWFIKCLATIGCEGHAAPAGLTDPPQECNVHNSGLEQEMLRGQRHLLLQLGVCG